MNPLRSIGDFLGNLVPSNTVSYKRQETPTTYKINGRNVSITDEDIRAIAPLIYGEISNRPVAKQELESRVILNTALNRMQEYARAGQPKTLSQVISMPNQYQAYGGQQYKYYSAPPDQPAMRKKQQVDSIVNNLSSEIKANKFQDNTSGSYYYKHNPDGSIAYDDSRPLIAGQKSPSQMRMLTTRRDFSSLNQ